MGYEAEHEPNVKQTVPLLSVTDIEASRRYYVDGLGFRMTHQWYFEERLQWCWLQHGSAAVMLQAIRRDGSHAGVSEGKLGGGVAIYFLCEDALALYREIIERGIQPQEPFVGNAMWVVGLTDPDGYALFFESPTDAPEEITLSEWRSLENNA